MSYEPDPQAAEEHDDHEDESHPPAAGFHATPHIEEEGEPWLISYADMMTLLFGLFAILLSFSKFDDSRFESVRKDVAKYFGGQYVAPLAGLREKLTEAVKLTGLAKDVEIQEVPDGVDLTFKSTILFGIGEAELQPAAKEPIENLIKVIMEKDKTLVIRVEGHTDDIPMSKNSERYPTNWELSGARAATIVRLFEASGFDPEKLVYSGYGSTRPRFPNRDPKGIPIPLNQAKNRRVVIKVAKPTISSINSTPVPVTAPEVMGPPPPVL